MNRYGFLLPFSLPLLAVAGYWLGGAWNFLTPVYSFALLPALDLLSGHSLFRPGQTEVVCLEQNPWFRALLYLGAAAHFALLSFGAWAVSRGGLSGYALWGFVLSVGTVSGSLGIVIAHELGHRVNSLDKMVSRAILVSVCYLHYYVEHNRGHHSRVATEEDPASARYGESVYAFLPRCIGGSFTHAWRLERERLAKSGHRPWHWSNPMLWSVVLPASIAAAFAYGFGPTAVAYFFVQAVVAVLLLETVDYIEHYGLARRSLPEGGYEKVTAAHSWNASQRLSSYYLFNLTRHPHHHIQSQRHYQALAHEAASPQMPVGYGGMIVLALVPPLWKRLIHPRLARDRAAAVQA